MLAATFSKIKDLERSRLIIPVDFIQQSRGSFTPIFNDIRPIFRQDTNRASTLSTAGTASSSGLSSLAAQMESGRVSADTYNSTPMPKRIRLTELDPLEVEDFFVPSTDEDSD